MAFTAFWTSTPEALQRSEEQNRMRQRENWFDPNIHIRIQLPDSRFPARQQIRAIKRALPYKLRKPELQKLERFLVENATLSCIVLPKRRTRNQPLDFNSSRIKWVDIRKENN